MSRVIDTAAKVLPWLEFWGKVLPFVQDAVQALYRKHDGNAEAAIADLRTVKDHWGDTESENDAFQKRLDALDDDAPKPVAAYDGPQAVEDEPEHIETDRG